jgi:addiction module HigA family antidote
VTVTTTIDDLREGRVDFGDLIEPGTGVLGPVHPGDILRDVLEETGMSAYALAKALRVPVNRVTAILGGKRAITADTALRLARCFSTSPELWLNLQTGYDLEVTRAERGAAIEAEVEPQAA